MRWLTILCFSAALGWTVVSFVAYRDFVFAFEASLVVWILAGLFWSVTRLKLRLPAKIGRAAGKVKIKHPSRLTTTGIVAALALIIFLFFGGQWLGKKYRALKDGLSVAFESGTSPTPSGAKERRKGEAAAERLSRDSEALWSVQVSSFRSEKHAIDLATALKERGWEAYVIHAKAEAGDLYRTHVGRFKTREAAEKLLQKLKDKETLGNAFVAKM